MNAFEVYNSLKLSLPDARHEYRGKTDKCDVRQHVGKQSWENKWRQVYNGSFLQDCLHGTGVYHWTTEREKYCYEGRLYCNDLDGYGLLSYPDGSTFEGLFKRNIRFGPGVFTCPNGEQDVGLWIGNNLARLSCAVRKESVPTLAKSTKSKVYLLRYKKIVPINIKMPSIAETILQSINASENLMNLRNNLYYDYVRHPKSLFFNKEMYDDYYFGEQKDFIIDVIESVRNDTPIITQIIATDLLAWNNDDVLISIMNHVFMHRQFESTLTYDILKILAGYRYCFNEPGSHEKLCKDFLETCDDGGDLLLNQVICNNDLYVNLCDSVGNFGIMYAAVKDNVKVIRMLTNFGGNLNQMNDECMTALSMCILRYLAVRNDVTDWEVAFLPNINQKGEYPNDEMWYPNLELDSDGIVSVMSAVNEAGGVQKYVLNLKPPKCPKPTTKVKKAKVKKPKKPKKPKKGYDAVLKAQKEKEEALDRQLDTIHRTILVLLGLKANPNVGEVPFPPLILSLFTYKCGMVSELINYGASVAVRTHRSDGALTALHVLASLPPSPDLLPMAELLINSGADVNAAANTSHWIKEKQAILAGTQCADGGKTPCQLLCMRWDFVKDPEDHLGHLCLLLMQRGADMKRTYLGHTSLSLAILKGNITLITNILQTGKVDPNQTLENDMGVPLTVLILKRYKHVLPLDVAMKVYDVLIAHNANPLNRLPGYEGNAVDFAFEMNDLIEKIEPVDKKGKKNKKKKKKKKINMKDKHMQLITHLQRCARTMLIRHIQGKTLRSIYSYAEFRENDIEGMSKVIRFFTLDETVNTLKILLDVHYIQPQETRLKYLLNFINSRTTKTKKNKKEKKDRKSEKTKSTKSSKKDNKLNIDDLVNYLQSNYNKQIKRPKVLPPEIDKCEDKYIVCFQCLQKKNKNLIKCPSCELVYFCSQKCNNKNISDKSSRHACKMKFYDSEKKRIEMEQRREEMLKKHGPNVKFDTLYGDLDSELGGRKGKKKRKGSRKEDTDTGSDSENETTKKGKKKSKGSGKDSEAESESEVTKKGKKKTKGSEKDSAGKSESEATKKGKKKTKQSGKDSESESESETIKKGKKKSKGYGKDSGSESESEATKKGKKSSKVPGNRSISKSRSEETRKDKKKGKTDSDEYGRGKSKKRSGTSKSSREDSRSKKTSSSRDRKSGSHGDYKRGRSIDKHGGKDKTKTRDKHSTSDKKTKSPSARSKSREVRKSTIRDKSKAVDKAKGKDYRGRSKTRDADEMQERDKSKGGDGMRDKFGGFGDERDKRDMGRAGILRGSEPLGVQYGAKGDERHAGLSNEYENMLFDILGGMDPEKFLEMFMPYCVFRNGEFYYKFGGIEAFFKLTYSDV